MCPVHCYCVLGHTFGLRSPSEAVTRILHHIFSGFCAPNTSPPGSPFDIRHDIDRGLYSVSRGDDLLDEYPNIGDLTTHLESRVFGEAFEGMPHLGVHAGSVRRGPVSLLLPGRSRSGKTSLVLGLLLQGWTLFSDEAAILRPDDATVLPFLRALYVKNGTIGMFRELDHEGLLTTPDTVLDIEGVSCVRPCAFETAAPDRSFDTDVVVFPRYTEGCEPDLTRVTRGKALALLMQNAFNRRAIPDHGLGLLGQLVERTSCFELRVGRLEPSLDLLDEACRET